MNKRPRFERKTLIALAVVASIFMVLVLLFFARGWIRQEVIPNYIAWRHANEIQTEFDHSLSELQTAFEGAGLTWSQTSPVDCSLSRAANFQTSAYCYVDGRSKTLSYSTSVEASQNARQITTKAEPALEELGWGGGPWDSANEDNFVYMYSKLHNDISCVVHIVNAGTNKVKGSTFCSKTYGFIGNP